jgi:succinate dehydrogenase / fumarate reductase flavoprotein subunit
VSGRSRTACLDFAGAIDRLGRDVVEERYSNLFEMYDRITDEDPYKVPMRIYPAVHYTMGGLWVDYNLMSNVPGLYVLDERTSPTTVRTASVRRLMQGLADGCFVLPATISDYRRCSARRRSPPAGRVRRRRAERATSAAVDVGEQQAQRRPLPPPARQHLVGQLRDGAGTESLEKALSDIPVARGFYADVNVLGSDETLSSRSRRTSSSSASCCTSALHP